MPDIVTIMEACKEHLESIKPPPAAPVNWSLTSDFDCYCKHCAEAQREVQSNQQTFEMINKFKKGSKAKLEHVAK